MPPRDHAAPRPPARVLSRVLAGLQGAALIVLVVLSALVDDAVSSWWWRLTVVAIAVLWFALRRRTRAVADRSAAALDERELAIRNQAAWWAFALAIGLGTALALVLAVLARADVDPAVVLDRAATTLLALMILAAALPSVLVAGMADDGDD